MSTTPKVKDRDYWKTGISRADRKARKRQYKRGTASDVAAHKSKVSAYKASKRKVKSQQSILPKPKTRKLKSTSKTLSGRERGSGQYYDKISNTWKSPKLTFEVRAKRREGKLEKKQGKLDAAGLALWDDLQMGKKGKSDAKIGRRTKKRDLMANKLQSSTKKANRIRSMREFEKTFGAKLRERKKLGIDKYFKSEYAKRKASYGGIKAIRDVTKKARKSIRGAFRKNFR